jgi:hypothetical protein
MTDLDMITYAHKGDKTIRFQQFAKDPIPKWAVDVQPVITRGVSRTEERDLAKLDEYLEKALVRIKGRSDLPLGVINKIKQLYAYTL